MRRSGNLASPTNSGPCCRAAERPGTAARRGGAKGRRGELNCDGWTQGFPMLTQREQSAIIGRKPTTSPLKTAARLEKSENRFCFVCRVRGSSEMAGLRAVEMLLASPMLGPGNALEMLIGCHSR